MVNDQESAAWPPDGEEYFKNNLKGAVIPGGVEGVHVFTGTLLSAEPAAQPSVLVMAISDGTTPEATLRFKDAEWQDNRLNGPLMRGSLIQFECSHVLYEGTVYVDAWLVDSAPEQVLEGC